MKKTIEDQVFDYLSIQVSCLMTSVNSKCHKFQYHLSTSSIQFQIKFKLNRFKERKRATIRVRDLKLISS